MIGSYDRPVHGRAESNFYAASALKSGEANDCSVPVPVFKHRDALVEPVVSGG